MTASRPRIPNAALIGLRRWRLRLWILAERRLRLAYDDLVDAEQR